MSRATIHETAIIDSGAVIEDGAYVGPYCCVGSEVVLGPNVKLKSHVVVTGITKICAGSIVYPFASLGQAPQDMKYKEEPSRLEIGENTVIREYVTANTGTENGGMVTRVGNECLIMAYCHIAHDCIIGNNVIMVNGVNLSGHVVVGDHAIIGGMSAVKQFIRIGKHAMIGGDTGVDRDVIPYGLVRGNRLTTLHGLNIIGLKRRGVPADVIKQMLEAYSDIFEYTDCSASFTDNLQAVSDKYVGQRNIEEIIDFIKSPSKNPICTTVANDER
ncbi:MAG: acyl-ACP--UDP-N-acetylglucosamine O-acyltransferase [Holosporales bacterium]|jgi:UDP-N-acetylglucosamine acyltransferase|nr:acyl-ACP--UDP-N-acetylglucosamine O-acyltransferase [Holosporales bacterium]